MTVEGRATVRFDAHLGRVESENGILRMSAGPLPAEVVRPLLGPDALRGLPVKVALLVLARGRKGRRYSARAPFLLAEVPSSVSRAAGAPLLEHALESALAEARGWFGVPVGPVRQATDAAARRAQVEAGLLALGWPWRRGSRPELGAGTAPGKAVGDGCDADVYRVTANDRGHGGNGTRVASLARPALRVEIRRVANGSHRVVATGAVAYGAPHCVLALERFALAANARLRLARVGVERGGAALMRIAWEACVIPEIDAEPAVPSVVEAVACAHATTSAGLTALGDPRVARAFLDLGW